MSIEYLARLCCSLLAALCLSMVGQKAVATEEPPYTLMEKKENLELRKYPSYIVAETYVEGGLETVGSEGFRRLAAYIGGKNTKKESISMTAPVTQEAESEKIAMTAPVTQEKEGNLWRITFMMPSEYTMDSLPRPTDDRISLALEPPKVVAVIRYSGTWSRERYEEHEAVLMNWVDGNGWQRAGQPIWARYDPPFKPWFMRRNEIMVPVEIE